MTQQEATDQSLASCGAFLIAFIGSVHEVVGAILYTWAPGFFTVPGFHAIGVIIISLGLLMLGGTLRLIRFPVVIAAIAVTIFCIGMLIFIALHFDQFHYFALCAAMAGVSTAILHTRAEKLRARREHP